MQEPRTNTVRMPKTIFRAYDIRGIVGDGLNCENIQVIGQAIGSEAIDAGEHTLLLAADARLSSPELAKALTKGILASGCHVIDLGVVPTPLLYFATHFLPHHSGVMLTGSHNPKNYNGIKIVLRQQCLAAQQITGLYDRIIANQLRHGKGRRDELDITPAYLQRITSDITLGRRPKIVIDCGNGVTSLIAPRLFEALNCEVLPLYCEIDGNFPNHHPDPTRLENLSDLIDKVVHKQADLGIAFDGDGDRVALVSTSGKVINADSLLQVFSRAILADNPGATIVFDVKSSHHLLREINRLKGRAVMCKSGHSYVKKALVENQALLGGEFSSHIFFKHRWYGFDDGMYVACRFLELMDKGQLTADELIMKLPVSFSTPELFIPVSENNKFAMAEKLKEILSFPDARLNYLDGVRVDFDYGWGLLRASNTSPALVMRFEADSEKQLAAIQARFKVAISSCYPELIF